MTPDEAYNSLGQSLERIQNVALRALYIRFHDANKAGFLAMPASVRKHHCWPGGYAIHIDEVVTNITTIIEHMPLIQDFTWDDAITAAYIHDIDKLLYRYEAGGEPPSDAQLKYARSLGIDTAGHNKSAVSLLIDAAIKKEPIDAERIPKHDYRKEALSFDDGALVMHLCCENQIVPSAMALHAVCWHHGGWAPIAQASRQGLSPVKPLGAILHAADFISASAQMGNRNLQLKGMQ